MKDARSRLPLWGHLLCGAAAVATFAAAVWQHQRAGLKQRMQQQLEARLAAEPLTIEQLLAMPASEAAWRRTALSGRYDQDGQFLLDNRVLDGRPGFHVIAPLQVAEDLWLLVNRGFLAGGADRARMRPPAAAAGEVFVSGPLVAPAGEAIELAGPAIDGLIWRRVDIDLWQQQSNRRALGLMLLADSEKSENGQDSQLVPVAKRPDLRAAVSRGYSLQWLLLCAVVVAGWLRVTRVLRSR